MVAWLHSPSARIGAWEICIPGEWYFMVAISHVQVVGGALDAFQKLDGAICGPTHQKYYTSNNHARHFQWNQRLTQYRSVVVAIVQVKGMSASCPPLTILGVGNLC